MSVCYQLTPTTIPCLQQDESDPYMNTTYCIHFTWGRTGQNARYPQPLAIPGNVFVEHVADSGLQADLTSSMLVQRLRGANCASAVRA